jgi:hypothetical protein
MDKSKQVNRIEKERNEELKPLTRRTEQQRNEKNRNRVEDKNDPKRKSFQARKTRETTNGKK